MNATDNIHMMKQQLAEQKSMKKMSTTSKSDHLTNIPCHCAASCQKKGDSYDAALKGIPVFIVNNGGKEHSFRQCSYSCIKDKNYCIRHAKQDKEKRILLSDLESRANDPENTSVRKVIVDKNSEKKTIRDPFYENMGTRGARKRSKINTTYDFDNEDDIILQILHHSNKAFKKALYEYANQIIETKKKSSSSHTSYMIQQPSTENSTSVNSPSVNSLSSLMAISAAATTPSNDDEEEEEETPATAAAAAESSSSVLDEEEEEDDAETASYTSSSSSDEEEEEEDEKEELEVEEITTNKGVSYALDNKGNVYDMDTLEDEDGPTSVGTLVEMKKKYSKIEHNDKYYTICKEFTDDDRSLLLCILSDKVFDLETKECVGKLKRAKNGDMKIEYTSDK